MAFLEEGGAAYVPPDLLTDSSDYNIDKNYFDVVVTDLKVDTDYNFQFAWVYEDKTVSQYSANYAVKTSSIVIPEVTDIITSWAASTLSIFFKRPEETIAGVLTNRAKSFIITLTALNGDGVSKTAKFTPNVDASQTQQKYEITEARMDTWRKSDGTKYIPPYFNGTIQVVNDDGTSIGVPFVSATNSDGITGSSIADNEWSLTSVLDGYIINIVAFTTASKAEFYSSTEVWESTTTGGPYSLVAKGTNPIARVYFSDLNNKYVKIRHVAKAGTFSNYSNEKTIKSANPSGYDASAPINTSVITAGTPAIDGDGLFDFNYKVPYTWTENADTTTLGYKIRFRINGSTAGYTYMSVPGRTTTSTYLYGVLAGQTYEVGLAVYDEYDNVSSTWSNSTVVVPAFTGAITGTKYLSAGDMKLGYGVGPGGEALNKGLYLSTNNYWYVYGNTSADNTARIKIGGPTDNVYWNGTSLSVTGQINANSGNFTGTVNIGSDTVQGQLRVVKTFSGGIPTAAVEIGKFSNAVSVAGVTGVSHGIYAYGTGGKYVLINAEDASIRANNVLLNGSLTTGTGSGSYITVGETTDSIKLYVAGLTYPGQITYAAWNGTTGNGTLTIAPPSNTNAVGAVPYIDIYSYTGGGIMSIFSPGTVTIDGTDIQLGNSGTNVSVSKLAWSAADPAATSTNKLVTVTPGGNLTTNGRAIWVSGSYGTTAPPVTTGQNGDILFST